MKLLYKTTLLYLLATAAILLVAGSALVLVIHRLENDEINEELRLQYESVVDQLRKGDVQSMALASIQEVRVDAPPSEIIGDTLIYDKIQGSYEDYKYLMATRKIAGKNYRIMVMDAHIGWGEYNKTVLAIFLIMGLLLGIAGALINYFSAHTIWKPFFKNLKILKRYSVSSDKPLQLQPSGIREFEELRSVLEEMAQRGANEFHTLREFTENASHELQTPLAVIKSKLDRLSQYPIGEEMAEHIVLAKAGVERLSRLNKSLLLLAKLENRAFTDVRPLNFCELLQQQVEQMEELFALRNINVNVVCSKVPLTANQYLSEVLISNLFSNALRYTPTGGLVSIRLTPQELLVCNTGDPASLNEMDLFQRFKKGNQDNKSTGLGLAIAKEICSTYGWRLTYKHAQGKHQFKVNFSSNSH